MSREQGPGSSFFTVKEYMTTQQRLQGACKAPWDARPWVGLLLQNEQLIWLCRRSMTCS